MPCAAGVYPGATARERLGAAFEQLHERGGALITQLWNGLSEMGRVHLYGPPPGTARTPTIAFTVDGVPSITVAKKLAERGVFVSHGDFYATTAVEKLVPNSSGLIRIGCACYTGMDEVERLLEVLSNLSSRS